MKRRLANRIFGAHERREGCVRFEDTVVVIDDDDADGGLVEKAARVGPAAAVAKTT